MTGGPLNGSRSPFCAALERQVRDLPRGQAVFSEGERLALTFGELLDRVAAWRGLLSGRVGSDGLAALATGNVAAFLEVFFALRALDVAVLPVEGALEARETSRVCERMRVRWLLHRNPALGGEALAGAPDPSVRLSRLGGEASLPQGTAVVKLTSGSTLEPRGACFTEEALVEGIAHIAEGMALTRADRVLLSIPLSHSYGFDNGVLSLAAVGTPLILQQDLLPAALRQTLARRQITFFPAVPALVRALTAGPWPARLPLRMVVSASAPLARDVAEQFAETTGLHVHQFYGATECGGISFETRPEESDAHGTVGRPLPGVAIELAEGGLVRVRSSANRFALLPCDGPVTAYVEAGDRACWSAQGRLKLIGRAQQFANIGGFKIDIGAIEAFLRRLPGVRDAAAVAVEDPVRGHRVVTFVESDGCSREELLDLCRASLSAREVPDEIRLVERLPVTPRGKLDRAKLAGLLAVPHG